MDLAAAFARWIRRCAARVSAADRSILESDLHDLELTTRKPKPRVPPDSERPRKSQMRR